jgi:hypothetical protein
LFKSRKVDTAVEPILFTQEARDLFVAAHMRRIFLQIYRMVGNVADAQDLTQEAFIKALQRTEQLKDEKKAAPVALLSVKLSMLPKATRRARKRNSSAMNIATICRMHSALSRPANGPLLSCAT